MELKRKIDNIVGKTLVLILILIVLNVLWQMITRFLLNNPSSFTDELAGYLMIWVTVLGVAYVSGRKMHVAIDLLPKKLNERGQRKLKRIINILIVVFCFSIFIIGGSGLVYQNFILEQKSTALQIPLGLVYLIFPVSGLLIVYYKIYDLKTLKKQ